MEKNETNYYEWLRIRAEAMATTEKNHHVADLLRMAPQLFALLLGLLRNESIPRNIQQTAASVLSYFLLPTDLIPEAFLGMEGIKDDLFLAALFLDRMKKMGQAPAAEAAWTGARPLFECVGEILRAEDLLVTPEIAATMRTALESRLG